MVKYKEADYKEVNVLGTDYKVYEGVDKNSDEEFENAVGFVDTTVKEIKVLRYSDYNDNLGDSEVYDKETIRHELVHAFLFESGLSNCSDWAENEEVVDWIALQLPKLFSACNKLDVL